MSPDAGAVLQRLCPQEPGLSTELVSRDDGTASLKMWFRAEPERWVMVIRCQIFFDVVLHEPLEPAALTAGLIDEDPTDEELVEYLTDDVRVALHVLLTRPARQVGRTGGVSITVVVAGESCVPRPAWVRCLACRRPHHVLRRLSGRA